MKRRVFVTNSAIEWLQFLEDERSKLEGVKCIRSGGTPIIMRGDEKVKNLATIHGMGALLEASLNNKAERLVFKNFTITFEGKKLCKISSPTSYRGRHITYRNRPGKK